MEQMTAALSGQIQAAADANANPAFAPWIHTAARHNGIRYVLMNARMTAGDAEQTHAFPRVPEKNAGMTDAGDTAEHALRALHVRIINA
jgi:hypothetical protein